MHFDEPHAAIRDDCRTKIEILHSQRRELYAQIVTEWMADRNRHEFALALLLCFDNHITSLLSAQLTYAHIKRLTALSLKSGILMRLRTLRSRALHNFYSEISAAEFARSPLGLRLQDPSWLTRLSSRQLLQLMLNIETELRAALLACLSPLRVSKSVLLCHADDDKQKLLTALQAINMVNEDDIDTLLHFLDSKGEKFATRHWDEPTTARYLGAVIKHLSKDDSYQMLASLQQQPRLLQELRTHFLPFEHIAHLEPAEIAEIFAECSERQSAYILFNTDQITRDLVLKALPEVTRLGVRQELQHLTADAKQHSANLYLSSRLQLEVRNYLHQLNQEVRTTEEQRCPF